MSDNKSYQISEVDGGSTKSLVKKSEWKRRLSNDLWWKITITLAVIIIAGFIIYKAVDDSKKSTTKSSLPAASSNGRKTDPENTPVTDEDGPELSTAALTMMDCTEGSIQNSRAQFTFQPFNADKPYITHGLEFSFDDVKRKPGVESEMTEFITKATSRVHYYYNIPRCRIGGGVQLDIEPHIRGPIVFAVDELCTNAYYFSKGKGWTEYISARDLDCSAHGKEETEVKESECLEGSIENSTSSFVYLPFGAIKPYRAIGVEFSFEMLAKKTKLGSKLTKLNKLVASTSGVHYYYNIPRCRIGGGLRLDKKPYIRGPLIFAVDEQCTKAYYFIEGRGWITYISARDIKCSSHGKNNETRCFKGSFDGSYSTFRFISYTTGLTNVTGIQYNFTKLVEKLQDLKTDYNLTRIPELTTTNDVSYYLNLHRCYNGGLADPNTNPPIGGADIFAISDNCSRVYYLSVSSGYQWKQYKSSQSIKCIKRHV